MSLVQGVYVRASIDAAPLRVTMMFQDGSAFSYDETRETIEQCFEHGYTCLGIWRVPFDEDGFAFNLVQDMLGGELLYTISANCGQVIAVSCTKREGADTLVCLKCQESKDPECEMCDGERRLQWP